MTSKGESKQGEPKTLAEQVRYHLDELITLSPLLAPYDVAEEERYREEFRVFYPSRYIEQDLLVAMLKKRIKKLEETGAIHTKQMPNGAIRIYNHINCYGTVEQWRKCPDQDCTLKMTQTHCPNFPDIRNQYETKVIIVKA
jgi:hypothetical protein